MVHQGQTASAIADSLYHAGLIHHPLPFRLWIRLTGTDRELSRGIYRFEGLVTLPALASHLRNGVRYAEQARLTIPEGLTLPQTIDLLVKNGVGDSLHFAALLADTAFIASLLPDSLFGEPLGKVTSLEGFLCPNTYYFPLGEENPEAEALLRLTSQFASMTADLSKTKDNTFSPYEVMKLASIVEREAKASEEMAVIAGVYVNRLRRGMLLQACPTVLYALALRGERRDHLFLNDLDIDSPYNTYKNLGLPPTPICSPSKSSIEAVLKPEQTDYYFFLADGQGRHRFSRTYEEHIRQKRDVQNGS